MDINDERLRLAKEMGADETINSLEVDLKTEVMKITNGDGFPRLVEASGASKLVGIYLVFYFSFALDSYTATYFCTIFRLMDASNYFRRVPNWCSLDYIGRHFMWKTI